MTDERAQKAMSITYPPEMLPSRHDEDASVISGGVEIRYQEGAIDEIIAKGANLHIEQMDNSGWCVILDMPDGIQWMFWVGAKNGRSHVEFRHTEISDADAAQPDAPAEKS